MLAVGYAAGTAGVGAGAAHTVTKRDCVAAANGHVSKFRACWRWARDHNERERLAHMPAQRMLASWYGPGFYGHGMACGGPLLTTSLVVAHRTLPCHTRLLICYRRCVIATVMDRGPYVVGRDLDLAGATKTAIGFDSVGIVTVRRA